MPQRKTAENASLGADWKLISAHFSSFRARFASRQAAVVGIRCDGSHLIRGIHVLDRDREPHIAEHIFE